MIPPRPPIHPSIVPVQQAYEADLVQEVAAAVASEKVVVVGVALLAPAKRARALLDAEKIPHRYLQYGTYLKGWRRRLALKMWVGWSTFPLIFINGTFIGGASDLRKLHASGELKTMLASSAHPN
jgi:monothiol glutaredoxin